MHTVDVLCKALEVLKADKSDLWLVPLEHFAGVSVHRLNPDTGKFKPAHGVIAYEPLRRWADAGADSAQLHKLIADCRLPEVSELRIV